MKQDPLPAAPGRRRSHYRGERRPVMVRLPPDVARRLSAQAAARDLSASDLAGDLIAGGLDAPTRRTATAAVATAPPSSAVAATRRTAVDLFAGAGGIGLGLVQSGLDLRLAIEQDPSAAAAHAQNLPGRVLDCDIREVEDRALLDGAGLAPGELDVLVGGPPCQAFSVIGSRIVMDPRNSLFMELLRAVRVMRPRAVVVENVPGMMSLSGGRYLAAVLSGLAEAGYRAACAELCAAQWGVPQMRWRLVVIAWRDDVGIEAGHGFPDPTHGAGVIGDLLTGVRNDTALMDGLLTTRDAIGDLPPVANGETAGAYDRRPSRPFQVAARTGPDGRRLPGAVLHDHRAVDPTPIVEQRIRRIRSGQDWRALPHDLLQPSMQRAHRGSHTSRYRRMEWNTVPRTIITHFRDPKSGAYIHPSEHRTITPREAARIQGLPDWFRFHGTVGERCAQIGNAVPPPLAAAMAREVMACLDGRPHAGRLTEPFRRRPIEFLGRHGELLG